MKPHSRLFLLLLSLTILIAHTNGDFPSGAHQAVRCILAHQAPEHCASVPKVIVPSNLLQDYNDSPLSLQEALLKDSLAQLSEDQVSNIPISLLYLIPRARLADLPIKQLKAILQKHSDDRSLVHQVAACLQHDNTMLKFIDKMNTTVPEEALQILAESMEITDLTEDFLKLPFIENKPLLAYLRPAVLFNVETSTLYSIFNVLRMAESKPPKKPAFYFLTEAAIKHKAPLSKLKGFVMGLNPDQLLNESLSFDISVSDFKLDLSLLQARALFERSYQNMSLSSSNFIDSKPLLYKLSPELLHRFPLNVQKYEVNYIENIAIIPLPTASQVTEYVKADCFLTSRLPKEDEFWDINIRHLGKWVYTLPLSSLEGYKTSGLSTAVLKTLESPALSPMQAYYLTGKGESLDVMTPNSVLDLEAFLHALPASQLTNRKLGEISYPVKLHLVSKLPANNLARTLSLVNRISSSIGDPADVGAEENSGDGSVLEELLGNSNINQILALLSPKDLALSAEAVLKFFADKRIQNSYSEIIEQLPQQILTALLEHHRMMKSSQWRWNSLLDHSQISNLLVGGLTCKHINEMDTGLFIPIMAHYNTVRKKIHPFPKNMQHCCLAKLMKHLKLKMTLTQSDSEYGLISLLEPIEIESVGGYALVDIPLDAMQVSPYLGHILSKIGQLSSTELMLSTDISRLKLIAEMAVDKEGSVDTFVLRNLVWFLSQTAKTPDLRLLLEAQLVDTTICLPAETRLHVAARLISVFGSPDQWRAGVLAALQDLLIVFSEEELNMIPFLSWTKAADSLVSHYNEVVDWIEPAAFYKVCASMLGKSEEIEYKKALGRYVHWRLTAAQRLLDSVVSLPHPAIIKQNYKYTHDDLLAHDEESKIPLTVFNPEMETDLIDDESEPDEITEESTTDGSTTEIEEDTTEKITSEESKSEKTTTEVSTTEENPTKESTSVKGTTKESTSEKGITVESATEKSPTRESTSLNGTTKESTSEKGITEENKIKNSSSANKSELHITKTIETQGSTPKKLSTKIFNKENIQNVTSETSATTKIGESKVSMLNGTTEESATINVTLPSAITLSDISHKNANNTEHVPLCTNSVNKDECRNSSSHSNSTKIEVFSTKTTAQPLVVRYNKMDGSEKNLKNNISDSDSLVFPNSVNLVSINSNTTKVHSEIQFNHTKDQTIANTNFEAVKVSPVPSKNQNDTARKFEYLISNSTLKSKDNITESTLSPKIYHIAGENSNSNKEGGEHHDNDEIEEEDDAEEEIPDYYTVRQGILMDSINATKKKRSIFFKSGEAKLSCKAIKMVGSLAELTLTTADLSDMSATEVADCRTEFGAMELSEAVQKIIWKKINNDLKLDGIHLLGRLLRLVSVADLWDIELSASEPWVLETIHAIIQHNNNTMVMKKFMEEVVKKNEKFSIDLLAVLGPAVCSLDPAGLKALSVVGLDLGHSCPSCLPYLAVRATEELGAVHLWTQHFVHSIQAVVAGLDLDNWKQLAASEHKPLSGLQPSAAKCLNTSHLEVLSPEQIRMIPTVTLLSLSDLQLAAFDSDQLEAVMSVTHPTVTDKMTPTKKIYVAGVPTGISSQVLPIPFLIVFLTVMNFFKSLNLK